MSTDYFPIIIEAVEPDGGWGEWRPEPGYIYTGVPERVYHSLPGISKHGLDNINRSPAYYQYHRSHPKSDADSSDALIIGSALDCLIFEPHEFDQRFIVEPENTDRRKRKEYAAWKEENANGRSILRIKQWDDIRAMRDSVQAHPYAAALLADGIPQPTVCWKDSLARVSDDREPTYRLCRGRLDWLATGHSVVVDLKTTAGDGGRYSNFSRAVHKFRYHVQESFYMAGLETVGYRVDVFVFLVVEKEPPHMVTIYALDRPWQVQGQILWERDMQVYHECMKSGEWPSYPSEPRMLEFPKWAERMDIS